MRWWIGLVLAALVATMAVTSIGYLAGADHTGSGTTLPSTVVTSPATGTSVATSSAPSSATPAPSGATTSPPSATSTTTGAVGYTMAEIAGHASSASCWLLVDGRVYDVTDYLRSHPGGARTITPWCGKEATTAFATEDGRGEHSSRAYQELEKYYLGDLAA